MRFAPSPTGRLHVGNIRTALINWLFAHKSGGKFMLRLDDTDQARSTEEFADGIREDLRWLGLDWDLEARQSDRFDRYDAMVAKLKADGRLYPCYETMEELDRRRKRKLARGLPPIYDRSGLREDDKERAAHEAEGRKPHWRFLMHNFDGEPDNIVETKIGWDDLVRGTQQVDLGSLSDPILVRADGSYLYTLPSVVDDIDFAISDVIRGEDHVANTAAQIQLFEALGGDIPKFGHHNLLIGADGQALSKRLGDLSISSFREDGLESLAVVSHAATIGTSDPVRPFHSLIDIEDQFSFSKLSRSPARFDPQELRALNGKLLHETVYAEVEARLDARLEGRSKPEVEAFWLAVRGNIERFGDVDMWNGIVWGAIEPVIEDGEFIARAAELLPDEPYDEMSWGVWTAAVKKETGAKGKALFRPLRLALTGMEFGPELKLLLPLIGREKAHARLSGEKA